MKSRTRKNQLLSVLDPELAPSEAVLWHGEPSAPGLVGLSQIAALALAAGLIVWAFFADKPYLALWALLILAIIRTRRHRIKTVLALTNKRFISAICITPFLMPFFTRRIVDSFPLDEIESIALSSEETATDRGSITFHARNAFRLGPTSLQKSFTLESVPDLASVQKALPKEYKSLLVENDS